MESKKGYCSWVVLPAHDWRQTKEGSNKASAERKSARLVDRICKVPIKVCLRDKSNSGQSDWLAARDEIVKGPKTKMRVKRGAAVAHDVEGALQLPTSEIIAKLGGDGICIVWRWKCNKVARFRLWWYWVNRHWNRCRYRCSLSSLGSTSLLYHSWVRLFLCLEFGLLSGAIPISY